MNDTKQNTKQSQTHGSRATRELGKAKSRSNLYGGEILYHQLTNRKEMKMNAIDQKDLAKVQQIVAAVKEKGGTPQIAIHTVPSLTKSGFYCTRYPQSLVVAGSNPRGPRGGTNGKWVDAMPIKTCKTYDEAKKFVADLRAAGVI